MKFVILTFLTGCAWGAGYLMILPYLNEPHEYITILVLGGMCAGAIASLSMYMPAYLAYILPMFIPVIVYNYSFLSVDRTILATMFVLFIIMVIISASINRKLLDENFKLFSEKEKLIDELKVISRTDALTNLYNRRYFEALLPQELNRAKRNKYPLSLISIDIDNFKLVNDHNGHPSGDKLLINFAFLLNQTFKRSSDKVFRIGGDEFALIIVNQPVKKTVAVCKSINEQFKNQILKQSGEFKSDWLQTHQITLSIGIVNIHSNYGTNIEHVINTADKALYQAKQQGKNQIILKKI